MVFLAYVFGPAESRNAVLTGSEAMPMVKLTQGVLKGEPPVLIPAVGFGTFGSVAVWRLLVGLGIRRMRVRVPV